MSQHNRGKWTKSTDQAVCRTQIMKATWNGKTIAESNSTLVVEGNHYFPADSINIQFFQPTEMHTVCGWKGTASYYDIVVNGETNKDAAWYYPETKPDAKKYRRIHRILERC